MKGDDSLARRRTALGANVLNMVHELTAFGTGDLPRGCQRWVKRWFRFGVLYGWGWLGSHDQLSGLMEPWTIARTEEAVIPDFDEALGQDMLEKATNKLLGMNSTAFAPTSIPIFVGECNLVVFQFENAVIADGYSKDIGKQIAQSCFAITNGKTICYPTLGPSLLRDEVVEVGLLQCIAKLAPKEDGERLGMDKKVLT